MTTDRPRRTDLDATDAVPTSSVERPGAISLAFTAYHAELLSFLRRATRNDATAEDMLQETFLRLTREIDAGRQPDNVRAWLYRVASNLVVSGARRRLTVINWLTRRGPSEASSSLGESPESGMLRSER